MRIPYSDRTVDVELPTTAGQPRVTVKGVMEAFFAQMPETFSNLLEAFVLTSPHCVRVTCRTPRAMEEFCHLGLTFRDTPVNFHRCKSAQWVNITKLSYGIPGEAISEALRPYGKVIRVKMDTFHNVYIGTRNVLMEISHPIPSRVRIADHWCDVFYPGQQRTCFTCHKTGHSSKDCPDKRVRAKAGTEAVDKQAPPVNVDTRAAKDDNVREENTTKQPATSESVTHEATPKSTEDANGEDEDNSNDLFDKLIAIATGKRDHSDVDSSDGNESAPEQKKGKQQASVPASPSMPISTDGDTPIFLQNLFSQLIDEAAETPLPEDDDDEDDDPKDETGMTEEDKAKGNPSTFPSTTRLPGQRRTSTRQMLRKQASTAQTTEDSSPASAQAAPSGNAYDGGEEDNGTENSMDLDNEHDNPTNPHNTNGKAKDPQEKEKDNPKSPGTTSGSAKDPDKKEDNPKNPDDTCSNATDLKRQVDDPKNQDATGKTTKDQAHESQESPLTQLTPNRPRRTTTTKNTSSQSYVQPDAFTLAMRSKKTRPTLVHGGGRRSSTKKGAPPS